MENHFLKQLATELIFWDCLDNEDDVSDDELGDDVDVFFQKQTGIFND